MTTRISFNANALRLGDSAYFWETMKALQPKALTLMDGLDAAKAGHEKLNGQTRVIHRAYSESEANVVGSGKYIAPKDLVQRWVNASYGPIYAYGVNEPGPSKATLDYLIEVGNRARDAGIHCCLGNIGPATWEIADINSGLFDAYLRMLDTHRGWHVGGWHTYMTALPPWGAAGRDFRDTVDPAKVQPQFWPTAEEVKNAALPGDAPKPGISGPNWLTMRTQWFDRRCATLGIAPLEWEITEAFWDFMPNLDKQFPDVIAVLTQRNGGRKPDKLDIRQLLAWWFPQWQYEEALFEILKWCDAVHPANYHGFTMFTWSESPDWAKSNFIPLRDLHQRLIAYSKAHAPVVEPPAPPPIVVTPPPVVSPPPPPVVEPPPTPPAALTANEAMRLSTLYTQKAALDNEFVAFWTSVYTRLTTVKG